MLKRRFTRLYWRIGEVAEITGISQQTLRAWEQELAILRPRRDASGVRVYRERDFRIVLVLQQLIEKEKWSVADVKELLVAAPDEIRAMINAVPPEAFGNAPDEPEVASVPRASEQTAEPAALATEPVALATEPVALATEPVALATEPVALAAETAAPAVETAAWVTAAERPAEVEEPEAAQSETPAEAPEASAEEAARSNLPEDAGEGDVTSDQTLVPVADDVVLGAAPPEQVIGDSGSTPAQGEDTAAEKAPVWSWNEPAPMTASSSGNDSPSPGQPGAPGGDSEGEAGPEPSGAAGEASLAEAEREELADEPAILSIGAEAQSATETQGIETQETVSSEEPNEPRAEPATEGGDEETRAGETDHSLQSPAPPDEAESRVGEESVGDEGEEVTERPAELPEEEKLIAGLVSPSDEELDTAVSVSVGENSRTEEELVEPEGSREDAASDDAPGAETELSTSSADVPVPRSESAEAEAAAEVIAPMEQPLAEEAALDPNAPLETIGEESEGAAQRVEDEQAVPVGNPVGAEGTAISLDTEAAEVVPQPAAVTVPEWPGLVAGVRAGLDEQGTAAEEPIPLESPVTSAEDGGDVTAAHGESVPEAESTDIKDPAPMIAPEGAEVEAEVDEPVPAEPPTAPAAGDGSVPGDADEDLEADNGDVFVLVPPLEPVDRGALPVSVVDELTALREELTSIAEMLAALGKKKQDGETPEMREESPEREGIAFANAESSDSGV